MALQLLLLLLHCSALLVRLGATAAVMASATSL
jgi:hypothetical protein